MSDSLKKEFTCDMCKKPSTSAKICRCKMAIYCDEECQAKHWDKHKKECEKFRHLFNKNSDISSDSSDFADFEIPRDTKTDFDELDIFEYFENSQIDDFCDFETAQTPKISNNEKDIEKPKTQKSPENNNLSVIDEFEDYEKKSNLDAENRFVLNLSDFNEYNFTEGIKKLLLKFKFDESKLIPFPKMRDSWEIKNLDVMPPDGTFMLFERSSLKIDNFLSVTFYADFLPAKCAVREAHFQTLRAKKSDRSAYEHFYRREEKLRRRERKMSRFYSEAISQFLRNGIKVINSFRSDVNGIYRFAGHSNSQIKNNSCYLVKAPSAEIHQTLHSIGNFDEIDDLVKLVKFLRFRKKFALLHMSIRNVHVICNFVYQCKKSEQAK
ncbi:hypothetical protein MHBO_002472 [Bonamia ostreae]|uniref:RNA-dependent RNA polymerase n=1 Tax=Bonamia ostreae TaxID=126728 RepID=A0ABV2AMD9_9EUKA